jgi:hypothetical protein
MVREDDSNKTNSLKVDQNSKNSDANIEEAEETKDMTEGTNEGQTS